MKTIYLTEAVPRSCSTCEHRCGSGYYAKCDFVGNYCDIERAYNTKCGSSFQGWTPRLGIFKRIAFWLTGVKG